jgi:glycerol kinase
MLLFDLHRKKWDEELLALFGVRIRRRARPASAIAAIACAVETHRRASRALTQRGGRLAP